MFFKITPYFLIYTVYFFESVNGVLRPTPRAKATLDYAWEESYEEINGELSESVNKKSQVIGAILSPLKYLGCYDVWKSHTPTLTTSIFLPDLSPSKCGKYCANTVSHGTSDIFLTRGLYCGCFSWSTDRLARVDEVFCYLKCAKTDSGEGDSSCGGTYAMSLYCDETSVTTGEICKNYILPPLIARARNDPSGKHLFDEDTDDDKSDTSESSDEADLLVLDQVILPCYNCTDPYQCYTSTFSPNLSYIPDNSPGACIEFCSREIEYYSGDLELVRKSTKYANLGWAFRGIAVCTCGCTDAFPAYENVSASENCNWSCPGKPTEMCGGAPPYVFTMYETKAKGGDGGGGEFSPTTYDLSTSAHEETTTTAYERSTTTTTEAIKTTSTGTGTTTTSATSTTSSTTGTTKATSTSTAATSTPSRTTSTTTTTSSIRTTLPTANECSTRCSATDKYGDVWEACAGTIANQSCPKQANGTAIWRCAASGEFIGTPDYSNCSTRWIGEIEIGEGEILPGFAKSIFEQIITNITRKDPIKPELDYFGHEITTILGFVAKVFKRLSPNTTLHSFENLTESSIEISQNILINSNPWEELQPYNRTFTGTDLINLIQTNIFALTSKVMEVEVPPAGNDYRKNFNTWDSGILISAGGQLKSLTGNQGIRFPFDQEFDEGSSIQLPDGWAEYIPAAELNFLGMTFSSDFVKPIFTGASVGADESVSTDVENLVMNGKLMTFSFAKPPPHHMIHFPGNGVNVRFRHDLDASLSKVKDIKRRLHDGEIPRPVLKSSKCMFWDTTTLKWSSTGCKLIWSGRTTTVCECSHLTSFAVLMDMHNYVGKEYALEILTLVLCPLSTICLFATIAIFTLIRSTHGTRTTITKNLCISLFVGNLLMLLVVDRNYLNMTEGLCSAAAIVAHYVFLTAFMWMGVQGYHLYKQMVHVFESGISYMTIYRVIAFGFPVIIVGCTAVVAFLQDDHAYGGEEFCWLQGYYIWAFMAPVAVISVMNTIVLIVTMRAAYHVRNPSSITQVRVRSTRVWVRGCLSITILLGLTWMSGFFMITDSSFSTAAAYVFTILNASQGIFLFLFHCLLNEKVRSAAASKSTFLPSWIFKTSSSDPSDTSQSKSKENNMKVQTVNTNGGTRAVLQRNHDPPKLTRRGSARQIHPPGANVLSIDSFNTSNSSVKSISGNESSGSRINLLYHPRK